MGKLAQCPYCHGMHRTKKAFNACRRKNEKLKWTKDGQRVRKGRSK